MKKIGLLFLCLYLISCREFVLSEKIVEERPLIKAEGYSIYITNYTEKNVWYRINTSFYQDKEPFGCQNYGNTVSNFFKTDYQGNVVEMASELEIIYDQLIAFNNFYYAARINEESNLALSEYNQDLVRTNLYQLNIKERIGDFEILYGGHLIPKGGNNYLYLGIIFKGNDKKLFVLEVKNGDIIRYQEGKQSNDKDGYIMLENSSIKVGDDYFYKYRKGKRVYLAKITPSSVNFEHKLLPENYLLNENYIPISNNSFGLLNADYASKNFDILSFNTSDNQIDKQKIELPFKKSDIKEIGIKNLQDKVFFKFLLKNGKSFMSELTKNGLSEPFEIDSYLNSLAFNGETFVEASGQFDEEYGASLLFIKPQGQTREVLFRGVKPHKFCLD